MQVLDYLFASEHPAAQLIKEYEVLLQDERADAGRFSEVLQKMEELQVRDYESKVKTIITRLELE